MRLEITIEHSIFRDVKTDKRSWTIAWIGDTYFELMYRDFTRLGLGLGRPFELNEIQYFKSLQYHVACGWEIKISTGMSLMLYRRKSFPLKFECVQVSLSITIIMFLCCYHKSYITMSRRGAFVWHSSRSPLFESLRARCCQEQWRRLDPTRES